MHVFILQSVHSFRMSTKRKTPWIEYNDDTVADSAFCMEYLNNKFGLDLNQKLSKEERAVARAFEKLCEDSLYWSVMLPVINCHGDGVSGIVFVMIEVTGLCQGYI